MGKSYGRKKIVHNYSKNQWSWGKSIATVAKVAAPLVGAYLGLNTEKKYRDYVLTNVNIDDNYGTPNAFYDLTAIAEGNAQDEREGISIKLVQCHYEFLIQAHASSTTIGLGCRMLIFRWDSDQQPAFPDFPLEYTDIRSPYSKQVGAKFHVLADQKIELVPSDENSKYTCPVKGTIKLNQHVRYNGNLQTDGTFGRLFVVFVSNEPTASGFFPVLNGIIRTDYVDN